MSRYVLAEATIRIHGIHRPILKSARNHRQSVATNQDRPLPPLTSGFAPCLSKKPYRQKNDTKKHIWKSMRLAMKTCMPATRAKIANHLQKNKLQLMHDAL